MCIRDSNDADYMTNGTTTADPFGQWEYTTTVLAQDGVYNIRAKGYGILSENTVIFSMSDNAAALDLGTFRAGYNEYNATDDTYISENAPLTSFSTGVTVSVRSEDVMNPLARFDVSGIPANARIVMAKLGLYSLDAEDCTNMVASSYQLLRTWDAATATWITATESVTWNIPGANSVIVDRLGEATYTETVKAPFTWYTWDVTQMVQNWVADGSTNYGVIVKAWTYGQEVFHADNNLDDPNVLLTLEPLASGVGGRRDFAASEYYELPRRPILFVTYVIP
jgi:hypothetical protein